MKIFPEESKVIDRQDPHKITGYHLFAASISLINVLILAVSWSFHMLVMFTTTPKSQWFNPFSKKNWVTHEYDHWYCNFLCNVEEVMLHQMHKGRHDYGAYWCKEEITENNQFETKYPTVA